MYLVQNQKNQIRKKFRLSGLKEIIAEFLIKSISFTSFIFIILIFIFVFRETLPIFFQQEKKATIENVEEYETYGDESISLNLLPTELTVTKNEQISDEGTLSKIIGEIWQPISNNPKFGLISLFIGSLKVTIIAILFAAPIAIAAALYTSFFASKKIRVILKPTIEFLASFPSVVIGFLALTVFATFFQQLFGTVFRLNAFVGGIALALAVIPIIYTVADDALVAIPTHFTEASYALGASKWQTAIYVILPGAIHGIFAAVLLGIGRAFGETMIVLMATGNAALISFNFAEPVRTLTATIGAEMAEVVFGDTHYNVLFFIGTLLLVFTFILNIIAEVVVKKGIIKKFSGSE